MQAIRISAALRGGLHTVSITLAPGVENEPSPDGQPVLYWEGPRTLLAHIPASALMHAGVPAVPPAALHPPAGR